MRIFTIGALVALLGCVTAFAATPVTKGIYGGVILVGRGAAGATLDMTRAQVIARLGRPLKGNGPVMSYENLPPGRISPKTPHGMFDLYLRKGRVRMIVISPHSGWHLPDGSRVFGRGVIAHLMKLYGRRLRPTRIEDGERLYRVTERYLGRAVWTEFYVEHFGTDASVYGFDMLFPLSS
jgi:hypothetical protein